MNFKHYCSRNSNNGGIISSLIIKAVLAVIVVKVIIEVIVAIAVEAEGRATLIHIRAQRSPYCTSCQGELSLSSQV